MHPKLATRHDGVEGVAAHGVKLLAIGIDRYRDRRIVPLRYASKDAESFWQLFVRPLGSQVQGTLLTNPRLEEIRHLLVSVFADSTPDDIAIVFYAGHGTRSQQLTATDTICDKLDSS